MTNIIDWQPPATFNPETPGLGLPPLEGVEHTLLYDPLPSRCNLDDGGNGRYESLRHGTYSHHQKIVLFEDKFIVYWTQHSRDENGPGQRVLAKLGTFNADRTDIVWGGDETLFEIAPAPVPVRRKHFEHEPNLIYETYAHGSLKLINGRLYMIGALSACHGWTDDVQYHGFPGKPLPPEHWFDAPNWEKDARFDIWWDLGCHFVQEWRLQNDKLFAASLLYKRNEPVTQVEVAVGRFKDVIPVIEPYASAIPFDQAPERMQDDVLNGTPEKFERMPKYAPGTWRLTEDGTSGLAHHSEFRRPDGSWVAIRDNLCNPGYYYAAEKDRYADDYPSAVRTNLFGHAMPVAGELPDGRPWVVCNNQSRHDMYLTLSEDGRTFDQTWLLLHNARGNTDGGMHKGGGPQYFQAVTVGGNIWVVYSIAKEQVGVTRIPISALPAPKNIEKRPNGTPVRHVWAAGTPDPAKPAAGFPVLDGVTHNLVFAGERQAGAYNHHSKLVWHNGALHAMWSNHPHGEDGPGQRVLYATSSDGRTWSEAVELFPPPQEVRPSEEKGLVLTPNNWVVADGRLYARAGCHANIGFENPDRSERVDVRDGMRPFRARKGYDRFCREVARNKGFGPIMPQGENTPAPTELNFTFLDWSDPAVQCTAAAIAETMRNPECTPSWGGNCPQGVDSNRLCEPTVYRTADGKFIVLLRDDNYSHRMYMSVSPDGRSWNPALPTDIPDSPSLTTNVKLDDGTILLIGNQMAPAFDNPEEVTHYRRDPLMVSVSPDGYRFEKSFALRCGQQEWRVPPQEVIGRGGGGQYPSAIVHEDVLYVLYSMGKEDIWCSSVEVENVAGAPRSGKRK